MKIGIDIDGVLNSQYNFCIDYGSKFCCELGEYKLENINVFNTTDMFLWSEDVAHKFWNKYRVELVVNLPARPFAAEVINKIKQEGNEIYIITARKNNDKWFSEKLENDVEGITINWLRENNINYDNIYFDVTDKGKFCKDHGIDVMIEDDPHNIQKIIGNTNVMIFDYPYNRNKEFSELTRVYSWYDIYSKISKLKFEIGNNIKILEANKDDIDDILDLKQKVYDYLEHKEWYEINGTNKMFLENLLLGDGLILKAVSNNKIIGFLITENHLQKDDPIIKFLHLENEIDKCAELSNAAVDINYRGNHLEQKMIKIAENKLLEKYDIKYIVGTVHPNNFASLKSLLNCGYEVVTQVKMYNNKDRNIILKSID